MGVCLLLIAALSALGKPAQALRGCEHARVCLSTRERTVTFMDLSPHSSR